MNGNVVFNPPGGLHNMPSVVAVSSSFDCHRSDTTYATLYVYSAHMWFLFSLLLLFALQSGVKTGGREAGVDQESVQHAAETDRNWNVCTGTGGGAGNSTSLLFAFILIVTYIYVTAGIINVFCVETPLLVVVPVPVLPGRGPAYSGPMRWGLL